MVEFGKWYEQPLLGFHAMPFMKIGSYIIAFRTAGKDWNYKVDTNDYYYKDLSSHKLAKLTEKEKRELNHNIIKYIFSKFFKAKMKHYYDRI